MPAFFKLREAFILWAEIKNGMMANASPAIYSHILLEL